MFQVQLGKFMITQQRGCMQGGDLPACKHERLSLRCTTLSNHRALDNTSASLEVIVRIAGRLLHRVLQGQRAAFACTSSLAGFTLARPGADMQDNLKGQRDVILRGGTRSEGRYLLSC
jgi:hypothetical protein